MKIIGSEMALEFAKKKLGSKAMIARTKTMFFVGLRLTHSWWHVKGEGKSWSEALRNAGITPPDPLGEVIEKVRQEGGGE